MIGWFVALAASSASAAPDAAPDAAPATAPGEDVPAYVENARSRVDWRIAQDEAVRVLSEYLQVDTTNPPGNEDQGVAFLGKLLDAEGIAWQRIELEPGRASLVARIPSAGKGKPLCLMHHIDTASYEVAKWPADTGPVSGAIKDGEVWGRGALDMKGMGVLEFMTVAWLVRTQIPLDRDVVLLAVADEEVDNRGAAQIATPEVWSTIGCDHMLNEGGLGIRDALFEGQAVHAISVAEKGALWLRLVAEGRAGHGSVPIPDEEAPSRLLRAMDALDHYRPTYRVDKSLYTLLDAAGRQHGGFAGFVLKSPALVRTVAWGKLRANPTVNAAMQDTVHLTGMFGAQQPNVVPSEVSAQYDCRLLLGTTPEAHLAKLQKLIEKIDGVRLEVIQGRPGNGSDPTDPLFQAVAKYAVEGRPNAVAGPLLSVGFTDSILLRPLGVQAYGYVPFEVSSELAATMHGHGERVPVDQVGEGLRRLFSAVVAFAGSP